VARIRFVAMSGMRTLDRIKEVGSLTTTICNWIAEELQLHRTKNVCDERLLK
jgi:hypothetical protein